MKIVDINGNLRECVRVYLDDKWPGFVSLDFESKLRVDDYKHTEWYPVEEFRKNNPDLEYLVKDVIKEANEVAGVVSSSDDTSLTDKTRKWEKDIYAGFPVWISRGKGEGQVRTATSNSKNTVVISHPWDVMPDKTSQYVISPNVHSPHAFGNNLPQAEKISKRKAKKEK